MNSRKHRTGISEFDNLMGSGIPSGNYLILGSPKVGKKVFVDQVAYLSASTNKAVVYITLDSSPDSIKMRMMDYGWNVENLEKRNIFQFVDGFTLWYTHPPVSSNEFAVESLTNVSKLLSVIVTALDKIGTGGIIIFSSLSTLMEHAGFQRSYSLMTGLKAIIEERNSLGFTVLTSGMHSEGEINAFKHIVDGIIEMQYELTSGEMKRKVRAIGIGAKLDYLDWKEFKITTSGIKLNI